MSRHIPSIADIAQRLPNYRIEGALAQGNMGVVYLAEEVALHRKVALKILSPALADQDRFRQRFALESEMAANLDHPNIIPIYSAGESDGLLYLVMRYVDGPDLGALLRTEGPFDLPRTVRVIRQIAAALDAAHATRLVHRDVKPGNVLFDRDSDHVYLCDFGIAKNAASDGTLTSTGQFVGTIDYVSPEQIQGKPVDGRADQYALACVLFQCLTGSVPYSREETTAVLWAHLTDDPPRVTDHRPELPGALNTVVAKALAKEPEKRYATCLQFAAALEDVARGGSGAVGPSAPASPPMVQAPAPASSSQATKASSSPPAPPPWVRTPAASSAPAEAPAPAPSYPDPAPSYPGPAPSYPGPAPSYPGPAPSYPGPTPSYPGPTPSYPGPAPSYPGPTPAPAQWQPPARRTQQRKVWPYVLMGIVGGLGLFAAVLWFLVNNLSGFPNRTEQQLRDRLPPAARGQCQGDAGPAGAEAAILCRPDGDTQVVFASFTSKTALGKAYDQAVQASAVTRGTGDCGAATGAEHVYLGDGMAAGRVLCYSQGGRAFMAWTDEKAAALGTISRPDSDDRRLFQVWSALVGIVPYPSPDEAALVAALNETSCRRAAPSSLDTFTGAVAAVECQPLSNGAETVRYYRFPNAAAMNGVYEGRKRAAAPKSSNCNGSTPGFSGEDSYGPASSGATVGNVLCSSRDGKVFIEWTHNPSFIIGQGVGTSPSALFKWWQASSSPKPDAVFQPVERQQAQFPTIAEQALLNLIPRRSRLQCTRASGDLAAAAFPGAIAGVSCGPTSGAQVAAYYQFADTQVMSTAYAALRDRRSPPTDRSCLESPPNFLAERPYQQDNVEVGRVLCFTDDGGAPVLVWTHDSLRVLAYAKAKGTDKRALIGWWVKESGPQG